MTIVRAGIRETDARWLARGLIVTLAFVMLLAWPVPEANAAPPEVSAQVEFVVGSEVGHGYEPDVPWDYGYTSGKPS